ncbi:MAG: family 16 glycosylhydrolase [Oscillospiraceae bacterium]|nr:family 16 glycosylhydrolase [Oscillospiraceae bacterium]
MKKLISILLAMLLVLGCFVACANNETKDDVVVTTVGEDTPATDAPETDAPETDAPETDAPETDAPETEAPATAAPETEAPATDAPETEAPATEAPKTEAPATEAPKTEAPATDYEPEKTMMINGKKYKLSFFDDFDGDKLDSTKWKFAPEQKRQDVGGYWDNSMISVENGTLVVSSAIREDGTPISGAIMTGNLFKQTKGYFEIRCKLHSAPGFWGAFWLMNEEMLYTNGKNDGTAKDGAEIDIFESCHVKQGKINQNIHYDGYGSGHVQVPHSETKSPTYDGEYHTFSFLWTDTEYVWYIDGEETYRLAEGSSKYPGCDEKPAFMIISSEFGTWAGKYDPATLPDQWYVDYVVVYAEDF